jgi:iron complex transport system ATP-binding protein
MVVELSDVTVERDGNDILSHVNWVVQPNERWVIMGSNGAGKTTMMQVCSGYIHPTTGAAKVLGYELGKTDVRELRTLIGISSAAIAALLPADETVFDSVLTSAYGITGRWRERYDEIDYVRAAKMIEAWNLSELQNQSIGTLSEGERKRVQIARALMCDPELLILDEPAAGLDVAGREDLIERLSALAKDPLAPALVLVTHHVEEIPPNFTHAMLLRNGRVSASGEISEIITSDPMSEAFDTPLVVEFGDDRWFARGRTPSRGRRARD